MMVSFNRDGSLSQFQELIIVIRMQVQLSPEQLAAVRRLAKDQGVSQAEVIRSALDAFIDKTRPDRREARERARRLIGTFSSGVTDLAERHDHYFAETIIAGPAPDAGENDR